MNKQEKRTFDFSVVVTALVLAISYLSYIYFGLNVVAEEIKPVTTHEVRELSVHKKQPLTVEPEPLEAPKPEPAKPQVSEKDLKLLAQIINAEAGNQPYEGKLAVGNVVMNRVDSPSFPDTIKEVVYQKGQFQPVRNGAINKKPNEESIQAAREVLEGRKVVSENVLFFYNPDISTSSWIFTRKVVTKIGDHAFAA